MAVVFHLQNDLPSPAEEQCWYANCITCDSFSHNFEFSYQMLLNSAYYPCWSLVFPFFFFIRKIERYIPTTHCQTIASVCGRHALEISVKVLSKLRASASCAFARKVHRRIVVYCCFVVAKKRKQPNKVVEINTQWSISKLSSGLYLKFRPLDKTIRILTFSYSHGQVGYCVFSKKEKE